MKRKRTAGPAALPPAEASSTDVNDHAFNTRKRARASSVPHAQPRIPESAVLVMDARPPEQNNHSGSRHRVSIGARTRPADPVVSSLSDSSEDEHVGSTAKDVDSYSRASEGRSRSGSSISLDSQDADDANSSLSLDSQDARDDLVLLLGNDAGHAEPGDSPDLTPALSTVASRQPSPSQNRPVRLDQHPPLLAEPHDLGTGQASHAHRPRHLPRKVVGKKQHTVQQLDFRTYCAAVKRSLAKVVRIDTRTWALETHSSRSKRSNCIVNRWTLVREMPVTTEPSRFTCSNCRDFDLFEICAHIQYVKSEDAQKLERGSHTDFPIAYAFNWEPPEMDRNGVLMFACLTTGSQKDALVAWKGCATQSAWECSADPKNYSCEHVKNAKMSNVVHELLGTGQKFEEDDFASCEEESATEEEDFEVRAADHERREKQSLQDKSDERSISFKPVGPPPFCRIVSDTELWYPTVTPLPEFIALPDDAHCICGASADKTAPKRVIMNAFIYSSFSAKLVQVEVQPCSDHPTSRGHLAGPDLRELGLFNFSNYSIFTHELLNSYTSRYFCHSAPFHGFCRTIRFDYQNHESKYPFVGNNLFRSAWFSWTNVMQLFGTGGTQSQSCPICGPEPDVCIADAKTLGFQWQYLTSSLTPPTEVLADAPIRRGVQPPPESTACVFGKPRQDAQRLCRWRASLTKIGKSKVRNIVGQLIENDAADIDADETGAVEQGRARQSDRDKVDATNIAAMPAVIHALAGQNTHLARLFDKFVNTTWDKHLEPSRRPYYDLLQQVLAYESVLQFAPRTSWNGLGMLALGNTDCMSELLREIPAFAIAAIQDQRDNDGKFSDDLRELAKFVRLRADRVYRALIDGNDHDDALTPAPPPPSLPGEWSETGQRYAGPRYRLRPSYPNLKHDNRADRSVVSEASAGGIGCNKYYESYGKRDLTGGIFAIWCPHLICIGWHCIPRGEGRNDAFSAFFTRWKKAPSVIIYDFACALAPYCMLREPNFFKDTRFLIDDFHAKGHTRCTAACMLRTYRKHNPKLSKVNSSAAECGNAGLNRIEKSIWNRTRIVHAHDIALRLEKPLTCVFDDDSLFLSYAE